MPMPRGRRPSTAALTRLGARKAVGVSAIVRDLELGRMVDWPSCPYSDTGDQRGYDKAKPRIEIAIKPCA